MKSLLVWVIGGIVALGAGMIVYFGLSTCNLIPLVLAVLATVFVFRSFLKDYL